MSKKLIAVASAAALALSALVGVAPSNAAADALTVAPVAENGVAAGSQATVPGSGLTATAAWEVAVPSQDVLRVTTTAARSAVELEISSRSNNASVTVTSTGTVKLLTAAQLAASTTTTATGTQSATFTTDATGKIKFYAYATGTSAGTITVVESGATPASNTYYLKGVTAASNAYTLSVVSPTTAGLGSNVEFSATVVDMFGNAIEAASGLVTAQTLGGDATGVTSPLVWSTTKKIYEGSFTNRTTAGPVALLVSLSNSADAVTALGAKTSSVFVNINGADLQAANAALQAQVATLQAQLADSRPKARSVTKKRFNTLARKWNAANPSARVALKK